MSLPKNMSEPTLSEPDPNTNSTKVKPDTVLVNSENGTVNDRKFSRPISREERWDEQIYAKCKEFGIPEPHGKFIAPRDMQSCGNPNITQFSLDLPEGLGRWVTLIEYQYTIEQINYQLLQAEKIDFKKVIWGILSCITCLCFELCRPSPVEKALSRIKNFIAHQNQCVYHPKGLHIVDPSLNGLRHIEFSSITFYPVKGFLEQNPKRRLD